MIKDNHMQIHFMIKIGGKSLKKLRRVKFFRIEISYDCVVVQGYRTRAKKSDPMESFPSIVSCSQLKKVKVSYLVVLWLSSSVKKFRMVGSSLGNKQ